MIGARGRESWLVLPHWATEWRRGVSGVHETVRTNVSLTFPVTWTFSASWCWCLCYSPPLNVLAAMRPSAPANKDRETTFRDIRKTDRSRTWASLNGGVIWIESRVGSVLQTYTSRHRPKANTLYGELQSSLDWCSLWECLGDVSYFTFNRVFHALARSTSPRSARMTDRT